MNGISIEGPNKRSRSNKRTGPTQKNKGLNNKSLVENIPELFSVLSSYEVFVKEELGFIEQEYMDKIHQHLREPEKDGLKILIVVNNFFCKSGYNVSAKAMGSNEFYLNNEMKIKEELENLENTINLIDVYKNKLNLETNKTLFITYDLIEDKELINKLIKAGKLITSTQKTKNLANKICINIVINGNLINMSDLTEAEYELLNIELKSKLKLALLKIITKLYSIGVILDYESIAGSCLDSRNSKMDINLIFNQVKYLVVDYFYNNNFAVYYNIVLHNLNKARGIPKQREENTANKRRVLIFNEESETMNDILQNQTLRDIVNSDKNLIDTIIKDKDIHKFDKEIIEKILIDKHIVPFITLNRIKIMLFIQFYPELDYLEIQDKIFELLIVSVQRNCGKFKDEILKTLENELTETNQHDEDFHEIVACVKRGEIEQALRIIEETLNATKLVSEIITITYKEKNIIINKFVPNIKHNIMTTMEKNSGRKLDILLVYQIYTESLSGGIRIDIDQWYQAYKELKTGTASKDNATYQMFVACIIDLITLGLINFISLRNIGINTKSKYVLTK